MESHAAEVFRRAERVDDRAEEYAQEVLPIAGAADRLVLKNLGELQVVHEEALQADTEKAGGDLGQLQDPEEDPRQIPRLAQKVLERPNHHHI